MKQHLLNILECPTCGGSLQLRIIEEKIDTGEILSGILSCHCHRFPIIAGIPYFHTGVIAEEAMMALQKGQPRKALRIVFELDDVRWDRLNSLLDNWETASFRCVLEILNQDEEGAYLLYRFSDPTYLSGKTVLDAIGENARCFERWVVDIGGGTGHLTRSLCTMPSESRTVLADVAFWKIWLAKHFIAPNCEPVCCDASKPLPFAEDSFSLVFSSDAFHYVWKRRLLASEMLRLAGQSGVIVLCHLHNALSWNESAGMPLAPSAYRRFFASKNARLFKESVFLDDHLEHRSIDLSRSYTDEELADEPALVCIASNSEDLFRVYPQSIVESQRDDLVLNPLYHLENGSDGPVYRLRFPSEIYALEYRQCRRYLPEELPVHDRPVIYMMLDLPDRYL
jgi:SAM-dependent methyltransferase/uncharacterized protein YbaR (Trm112 family)